MGKSPSTDFQGPDMLPLSGYFQLNPEAPIESWLLILDEISFCPEAVNLLNSQALSAIFRYAVFITSYPVKTWNPDEILQLPVYPLEFDEFLLATGNDWYIEAIITHFNSDTKIPEIVHKELLALHQLYLQIGGTPGMINEYLNLSSVVNVSEQHSFLIGSTGL
jgi:predicted AAA+ superfamily ATPase